MTKTIRFKSTPENFQKECLGLKPNTLRTPTEPNDIRFELLVSFIHKEITLLDIEIENSISGEVFTRRVVDVTQYEHWYIISWKHS